MNYSIRILVAIIYLLFILGFPFFTVGGWMLFLIPFLILGALVVSIFDVVKFVGGHINLNQILGLAGIYATLWLCLPDGGDGGSFNGIEIVIGHIRGIIVTSHFLPSPITTTLSIFFPLLFILFIVLSIKFLF